MVFQSQDVRQNCYLPILSDQPHSDASHRGFNGHPRIHERKHAAADAAELPDESKGKRDRTLRVEISGSTHDGRRAAEPALEANVKRWQFIKASSNGPTSEILEYRVRLKKSADPADFLGRFRAAAGTIVQSADLGE